MKHQINNNTLPVTQYYISTHNKSKRVELYELRDNDEYTLYSNTDLENIKCKKEDYIQSNSMFNDNNLKIVKIDILFTEI